MNYDNLKERFDDQGFTIIRGFLNGKEISEIKTALENLISSNLESMPSNYVVYETKDNPGTIKQLQDLQKYVPSFGEMLNNGKFKALAEALLNENVVGRNVEYFNKIPKIGKPTPPHQDNFYFMLTPPSALTMWLSLDDVDESNGCVRYIKGSHLKGMRSHKRNYTLGFSQAIEDYGEKETKDDEIFFKTVPGDLLVHHSMTIHRADGNSSDRQRRSLGFIYFGESAKEDRERKESYQKKLREELEKNIR